MNADPHAYAAHGPRKVLWPFVFAVVMLHSILGLLGAHAGSLRAACAAPAAEVVRLSATTDEGAGERRAGRPGEGLVGGAGGGHVTGVGLDEDPGAGDGESPEEDMGGRAAEPGRPCGPAPHPHHPPCGALGDRGPGHQRVTVPWQAASGPRCPLPVDHGRRLAGPGRACPRGRASQTPAPRSGAGLLIDLCASRT